MKTLNPNPDSTIFFFARHGDVRHVIARGLRLVLMTGVLGLIAMPGEGSAALAQTAPPTPQPLIVADFNHDGIPDALVMSTVTPTATIAFGSVPYGSFGAGSKAVTFPSSCVNPLAGALVVGDFNGDGFPDIAFFCASGSGTMLGNGDGTFGAAITLAGAGVGPAVVGDFDKDGKLDVAVLVNNTGNTPVEQIQFFSGKGNGMFSEVVLSTLPAETYNAMVVSDLNGDGYPDLVLLNSPTDGSRSIEVYGNNKDGTFGSVGSGFFSANTTATVASLGATTLLTGNFFGVATNDIVAAGLGQNGSLYAFQNTSTATSFSFNDPVTVAVANLTGAQAGMFTGSGFADVAVSNGTNIAVLANDGRANFATNYSTLALVSATSKFAVADANGDGYSDLYTASLPSSGAMQLGVGLTTGSATATSQPFSLAAGMRSIGAAWVGNVDFTGSNATGSQIVIGVASATTLASSKNPSLTGDSVTFTVRVGAGPNTGVTQTPTGMVVLTDGTNPLASGALDGTGSYTFTTATLTQATHPITATYAGDGTYATSSAMLSQVVEGISVTSLTPTTVTLGSGATTVTINGTGFRGNSVVQVNGTAIATMLVNPTTLSAVIPASDFQTVGSLQITVFDPSVSSSSAAVQLTVTAPAPSPVVVVPPTTAPGSQPTVTLSLTQPYPVDITATVTLSFSASTTPAIDDPNIVFATTGSRTENVTIPAGSVTVPPIALQAGTVAGTITVPLKLTAGGIDVTPTTLQPAVIRVPAAVPTISTVATKRSGNQLTVVMHGFSNTREVVNAKFHFTPAAGATLDTTDLTIPGATIFNTNWFQTTTSDQYGSTFTYTQIFNTSDDATTVGSVDVTLSNTVGASEMKTTQ